MSTGTLEVDTLPALPSHAFRPFHKSSPSVDSNEISRSASYTTLPGVGDTAHPIKRTFSDNVLSSLAQKPGKITSSVQNANVELFRRASQKTKKRMSAARFVSANEVEESERPGRTMDKVDNASTKSAKGAFRVFSRKSWMSSSRPQSPVRKDEPAPSQKRNPSPTKQQTESSSQSIAIPQPVATRTSPRSSYNADAASTTSDNGTVPSRRDTSSPTPPSQTTSENSTEESEASSMVKSRRSSFSSLRSRPSIDRMYLKVPATKVPPMPNHSSISPDRLSGQSNDSSRRKDPHWIAFRAIDGEFATFMSKTSLQKAKVVRSVLLPFLSKTADRASVDVLRAEDLDRRAVILNKWWTGFLELLNSSAQQSISGTDRPAFLEAICEIMTRLEWKVPPFEEPYGESSRSSADVAKTDSTSSTDGEEPDALMRNIYHNLRNMFLQNITQQLAFVIDKLCMRAAPASLVIFGGKTCAYAFFYCSGVADMLSRLWRIPSGTLRRVLAEYGPQCGRKAGIISRALESSFPPAIRSLCFTSHAALSRQLQSKMQIPANTAHIRWHGPWINRWIGRDSDLFFVFVKHYHILVADHLPRHLLPEERMGIPGFVVVHAQVLLNLESALYRQAGHVAAEHYAPQVGENPDAMAPMPMVIPNATRSIGENRLVMLLRDCIGDKKPEHKALADILVGPFQYVLKAAVRKVSMYNNDACFVLCDFLEELVPLVTKYQRLHVESEDWSFWLKVYKQMMHSEATMTQIRVIAFLYSTWPLMIIDDERKRQVVLEWLLQPAFFTQYFNHWSPMVRHYFFRLLCWRVGRSNGPASEVDLEIYRRLSDLLTRNWQHHAYLTADAEMRDTASPSTNPCAPAPGRALLIIRTDSPHDTGRFTTFDKLMPSSGLQSSPYSSQSSMLSKVPEADPQQSGAKKRWSILKAVNIFSAPTNHRPGEVTPPGSPDNDPAKKKAPEGLSRPSTPPHQTLTFKFSLEYTNARPGIPAKVRKLPLPVLPHTSQKLLDDLRKLEGLSSKEMLLAKEVKPVKPQSGEMTTARYCGRALSEWAQVVQECRNFYTRRKQEGCPNDAAVETPNIAVESFRMFG